MLAERARTSREGWGVAVAVLAVAAAAWLATWRLSGPGGEFLMAEATGARAAAWPAFLAMSGAMMAAMMLPSAVPMVRTFRGLAAREAGEAEAARRTALFVVGYLLVWSAFAAAALAVFGLLGLFRSMGGAAALAPGVLLVAAGAYQATPWKRRCLDRCRTPAAFLLGRWRGGRLGALRTGVAHGRECLGCCVLLMLALFATGAMSLLWMGVFAAVVLAEKLAPRPDRVSAAVAAVAVVGGLAWLALRL